MTFPSPGPATQSTGNVAGGPYGAWSGTNTTAQIGPAGILIPLGAGGGPAIGAGANSITSGTAVFSNANGVSFGIAGQTVTASAAAGGVVLYDGANSITSGTAQFSNANGVTFGIVGQTITASIPAVGGAQTGISSIADSAHTQTVGMLSFANSNGLSFGLSTGAASATLTASYTVPSTAGLLSVLNVSAGAGTSKALTGLTFANSNGLTFGLSTGASAGTLTGSYTVPSLAGLLSAVNISGGTTSSNVSAVTFSNANGISFGYDGTNVSATYTVPSTAGLLSAVNISAANAGSNLSAVNFSNLNGVSFGLSTAAGAVGTITASVAAGGGGGAAISIGGNSTSAGAGYSNITSGTAIFLGGNNITLSQNGASITISGPNAGGAQTGISGIIVSNTTYTSGTVSFSNANGISFGSSAGQAITASYTVPAVPTSYVSNVNGSSGAISLATGSSLSSSSNGSTITFGLASNITTALQSAGAYLTTAAQSSASNVSVVYAATNNTGGGTATLSGGVSFSNANGVTFYTSAGNAVVASYTVPTQTVQTLSAIVSSNTTGNTSGMTFDARSHSFQGYGIISVGLSTTNTGSSILFSATQSNQAMSAQGGSSAFQTLIFTNSNNVSFSNTGGSVWGSYALNVSGGAGTSNAVSGITFANSNGVTFGVSTGAGVATITASYTVPTQSNQTLGLYALSQTTGGASSTTLDARTLSFNLYGAMSGGFSAGSVQLSVPGTSSLSAGAGISISVNGNTIVIMTM